MAARRLPPALLLPERVHRQAELARSLQDHLRIARAVQSGDEAAAAEAMQLHVPAGSTGFSEFLATVPASFFEHDNPDHG